MGAATFVRWRIGFVVVLVAWIASACAGQMTVVIEGGNVQVKSWAEAVEDERFDDAAIAAFSNFRATVPDDLQHTHIRFRGRCKEPRRDTRWRRTGPAWPR